jgi:hypothetical protein
MAQPPDPPEVTIVDPSSPAGTADLLDSGRDPWRPSRTQVLVGAVVVLLLGLATGAVAQVRHVRHEHALDRADHRQLRLFTTTTCCDLVADSPLRLLVGVRNDGPDVVALERMRFAGVADWVPDSEVLLVPGATTDLPLPLRSSCAGAAGRGTGNEVLLDLRLVHGSRVHRTVTLDETTKLQVAQEIRSGCRMGVPNEALSADIVRSRVRGRSLVLDLLLSNRSVLPLTVRDPAPTPGLLVTGLTTPLTLPPQPSADAEPPQVQVTLVVTVADCSAFRRDQGQAEFSEPHLELTLAGPYETVPFTLAFNTENNGILASEVYASRVLRGWCGLPVA